MTDTKISTEILGDRMQLWFFRDLSDEQRVKLLRLCFYPDTQFATHSSQQIAFRTVLSALASRHQEPVNEPAEWQVEAAARAIASTAYDGIYFTSRSRERYIDEEWRNHETDARTALRAASIPKVEPDHIPDAGKKVETTYVQKMHESQPSTSEGEAVAYIVERPLVSGGVDWYLPFLRAGEEYERYRAANPDETLRPLYAAPQPAPVVTDAARDVLAERKRQVEAEGWTPEHDDEYADGEMAEAAAGYAAKATGTNGNPKYPPHNWPWDVKWWKPAAPRRMLVKAGALILAEIERLDRASLQKQESGE